MRKIICWISFAILFGALFGIGAAYKTFIATPLIAANQPLDYVLKPGSSVKTLADDLHVRGILAHPNFLIGLAYLKGSAHKLKAGEYLFAPGITPAQLLDQIVTGKVIYHRFTLVEGWTFKQVIAALNNDPAITHTLNSVGDADILNKLGMPPRNPEGLFLPATYHFSLGMSDAALLKMAYQKMTKTLTKEWQQRAANLPYQTSYEALIVASLIEKETAQANERPIVAGVILRRLKNNMPLQIDSTLIYGLGSNYTGKLNRAALAQDTPYNTYLHGGLPPTPIAMPSLPSIHAALHPDNSNFLYFVAKGDGTHQFSANLPAQNQAVNTYQIAVHLPTIGKRLNTRMCIRPWYASETLQNLIECPK
jgi:UPF0755 protein